ncbi:hypothetical protein [Roseospirillum parvum]|uniref:Uncharacterized protein n=1 Tax=Roseospirillum parvum TaxID=83401 RepID=A0A1G7V3N3_9PROT|nr:hypothetical protein [Roseospirillum parvum]SDG54383.1 hypothetical protein SAMN05421742_101527 [Roseospirillum parvum]
MSFDRPLRLPAQVPANTSAQTPAQTPEVVRETLTSLEAKLFAHRPCGRFPLCLGREMIKACHRTMADSRLRHIALADPDYMDRFVDALTGHFGDCCGLDCEVAADALGALQDVICALEALADGPGAPLSLPGDDNSRILEAAQ